MGELTSQYLLHKQQCVVLRRQSSTVYRFSIKVSCIHPLCGLYILHTYYPIKGKALIMSRGKCAGTLCSILCRYFGELLKTKVSLLHIPNPHRKTCITHKCLVSCFFLSPGGGRESWSVDFLWTDSFFFFFFWNCIILV